MRLLIKPQVSSHGWTERLLKQSYFYAGFDKHSNKINIQTIEAFKGTVIQFVSKRR